MLRWLGIKDIKEFGDLSPEVKNFWITAWNEWGHSNR